MAGKSRHGKRSHTGGGKKKKVRRVVPAVAVEQREAVVQAGEGVAGAKPVAPPAATAVQRTAPAEARYLYVTGELRRIGIMAGIILVILVVLARVLP